ncbi:hypothetical protein [Kingella potus]|uniref:hypothetical protein n=1 Tax=Kingella potus TaxID=265175 RepID=UPI001FD42A2D|nr:hypothetical protein [Kingella potus]UOP00187.1 hypothetical protein LVJ84_09625 [Kingella potus]
MFTGSVCGQSAKPRASRCGTPYADSQDKCKGGRLKALQWVFRRPVRLLRLIRACL